MNTQLFHEAIVEGNPSPLEELAEEAGYTEKFTPLDTRIMRARPLRFFDLTGDRVERNDANTQDDMFHRIYFWAQDFQYHALHPFLSAIKKKKPIDYSINDSPRSDWNQRYVDFFTRIKQTEDGVYFVDCFQPKPAHNEGRGKNKLALMKGKFKEGWYDWNDRKLDDETSRVLNLARLRESYPPYSTLDIILGPNAEWVIGKAGGGTALFMLMLAPFFREQREVGLYVASTITTAFEFLLHQGMYKSVGHGYFRKRGVEVGNSAVNYLVQEATK